MCQQFFPFRVCFNFYTNSLVSSNEIRDRQIKKQLFLNQNFEVNFHLNSKKFLKTIKMKCLCIQKDTFHNIEQSAYGITISSKQTFLATGRYLSSNRWTLSHFPWLTEYVLLFIISFLFLSTSKT